MACFCLYEDSVRANVMCVEGYQASEFHRDLVLE